MILKSFNVEAKVRGKIAWKFNPITFSNYNLIVGKNSSGKTRLLGILEKFSDLFLNRIKINEVGVGVITAKFIFSSISSKNNSDNYIYEITIDNFSENEAFVVKESIKHNHEILLDRKKDITLILDKSEIKAELKHIYPPSNEIVLSVRRDEIYFPFLEVLYEWASNFKFFRFGHFHSYTPTFAPYASQDLDDAGEIYENLDYEEKHNVLSNIRSMGFLINKIEVIPIPGMESRKLKLFRLEEDDVIIPIIHLDISQGLYRTILILIYLEYLHKLNKGTIAIDDLAEGLDYQRASKLVQLIYEKFKSANIQIIIASNDSFVLNHVDLYYWKILQRKGGIVDIIDYDNSSKLFEEFKQIGLNNFDFLTIDFPNRHG